MSNYFEKFPQVYYRFGDETDPVLFQKLTKYSDIIDTIRDDVGAYIEHEIRDFDRPDTLSHRLYKKSEYDWTFFIMNERLRETGWPMPMSELYSHAQTQMFPNYTAILDISTADSAALFTNLYPVGQRVRLGMKEGVVVRKNLDVGEITIEADSDLTTLTTLSYADSAQSNEVSLLNTVYEYQGTHHYENDSGEWVDYFFSTDPVKVPITNLDYLINENDASKRIRVIKKEFIDTIVGRFKNAIENE